MEVWLPPKSLDWESDVDSRTKNKESSEGTSSDEEYGEHNVENLALEVVGQGGSGELVYLFLEDWELARAALSCHLVWTCCVRKCKRLDSCVTAAW